MYTPDNFFGSNLVFHTNIQVILYVTTMNHSQKEDKGRTNKAPNVNQILLDVNSNKGRPL